MYRNCVCVCTLRWMRCADWKHGKKRKILLDLLVHLWVFAHRVNLHTTKNQLFHVQCTKRGLQQFSTHFLFLFRVQYFSFVHSLHPWQWEMTKSNRHTPYANVTFEMPKFYKWNCAVIVTGTGTGTSICTSEVSRCIKDWMGNGFRANCKAVNVHKARIAMCVCVCFNYIERKNWLMKEDVREPVREPVRVRVHTDKRPW